MNTDVSFIFEYLKVLLHYIITLIRKRVDFSDGWQKSQ